MDRRMMNEWLKAQAQKQQLTERSFQQKRLGINIREAAPPHYFPFKGANPATPPAQPLSTSQDGSNVVPTSQRERNTPGGVGVPSDIPKPSTVSDSGRMGRDGRVPQIGDRRGITDLNPNSGGMSDYDSGKYDERGDGDLAKMSPGGKRPQPLPQPVAKPVAKPNSNPRVNKDIDRMTGRGLY